MPPWALCSCFRTGSRHKEADFLGEETPIPRRETPQGQPRSPRCPSAPHITPINEQSNATGPSDLVSARSDVKSCVLKTDTTHNSPSSQHTSPPSVITTERAWCSNDAEDLQVSSQHPGNQSPRGAAEQKPSRPQGQESSADGDSWDGPTIADEAAPDKEAVARQVEEEDGVSNVDGVQDETVAAPEDVRASEGPPVRLSDLDTLPSQRRRRKELSRQSAYTRRKSDPRA